ncbi:MAG: PAS domain-containing protein [Leptolyngbyaceae bacterium]|nr:PAS domain-containing protein [Leptolyngbyaceae bacterium]
MQIPAQPVNEPDRLNALQRYQILDTLPEQDYDDYVKIAAQICGTPIALISFVDEQRQWFKAKVGLEANETPRNISLCGHVVAQSSTLLISDTKKDPRFADNPLVVSEPKIRFYAGVPLVAPDQYVLGTLCVLDQRPRALTQAQIQQLELLAHLIVSQLELRRKQYATQALAEDILRVSEQRYATLASLAPVGIFRTDINGNCIYVNERWCNIAGLTPEAAAGQGWQRALHPDDRDSISTEWYQSAQEQRPFELEYRFQRPDGYVTWVYGQSTAEYDDSGHILGYVGTVTDISDRKQAEQALKLMEERLQATQRIAHLGSWELDLQTGALFWSAEVFRLLELDPQAVTPSYDLLMAVTHPDDRDMIDTAYQKHLADRTPYRIVHRLQMPDGRIKYVQEQCETLYGEDGTPLLSKGAIQDVTDLYQTQRALQQLNAELEDRVKNRTAQLEQRDADLRNLNQRLQLAARSAQLGIWDWSVPDDCMTWDDRMYELYGASRSNAPATYELWQRSLHPEDRDQAMAVLQAALAGEREFDPLFRIVRPDGQVRWIEARAMVQRDGNGKAERMIGTNADVSDRQIAEIALQASQQKFQRLVEDIGDKFVIFSYVQSTSIVTYVSAGIKSVFGLEKQDVLDKAWQVAIDWLPQSLELAQAKVAELLQHSLDSQQFEMEFIHPDGDRRTIHVCQHPTRDSHGQIIAIEGIVEDITARKRYETQLQQKNQELARATRLKDEFLANMSHELRTPLNAILGMTESLQEEAYGPVNYRQQEALETVFQSGTHLLPLINDILDLAKVESGQIDLEYQLTNIKELCESSVVFIKQQAYKKQIQVQVQIASQLPDVTMDERRIRQALINLLTNAVKFTPDQGSVTLQVMVEPQSETLPATVQRPGASNPTQGSGTLYWLKFAVIDTGIGISQQDMAKLFQPFIQVDSALNRKYAGTGLGLSLVKRIVELHGGTVGLSSQEGQGSQFWFVLPCEYAPTPLPYPPADPTPGQGAMPSPDGIAYRILLVEDNLANIKTMSGYLTTKGYEVILAHNGAEAIAQTQTHQPDLILMDIQMPDMDGLEAIQRIRTQLQLVDMPIIALTALAMAGDQEKCMTAGATAYLSKPVKLRQLVTTIQQVLTLT